jgi:hypothetical protein
VIGEKDLIGVSFLITFISLREDRAGTEGLWRTAGMSLEINRKILINGGGATTNTFYSNNIQNLFTNQMSEELPTVLKSIFIPEPCRNPP